MRPYTFCRHARSYIESTDAPVRARSLAIASPLPSLRSSTPSGRVPSHRSYVSCMHLSAPLPPSLPDPEKGPTTAPREAKWMRIGCELGACPPQSSSCLHAKAPPRTEQPSMADFALPCGEARKLLGNCADGRLGASCLSSLQSLEFRRAIFPSPSLRCAWRQSGGGGDR